MQFSNDIHGMSYVMLVLYTLQKSFEGIKDAKTSSHR